jgi:hypothetical protein
MPFMTNGKRDYKKEDAWDKKHKAANGVSRGKARAMRNKARAMVAKKNGTTPTAIKGDVGHKKAVGKGGQSVLANLFIQNPGENRSFSRNKNGSMKSERSKRESKKG